MRSRRIMRMAASRSKDAGDRVNARASPPSGLGLIPMQAAQMAALMVGVLGRHSVLSGIGLPRLGGAYSVWRRRRAGLARATHHPSSTTSMVTPALMSRLQVIPGPLRDQSHHRYPPSAAAASSTATMSRYPTCRDSPVSSAAEVMPANSTAT